MSQRQISDSLVQISESLEEIPVHNLRLHFLTQTDLKSFLKYYDKLRQWIEQTVEHYQSLLHNSHEIM